MKTLKCKNVFADETFDEFCQVTFEKESDSSQHYFLIQRGFEYENIFGKHIYIECDDYTFTGHNIIKKALLERNRFYIILNNLEKSEIEIIFNIAKNKYKKIKEVIEIIFTGFDNLKTCC